MKVPQVKRKCDVAANDHSSCSSYICDGVKKTKVFHPTSHNSRNGIQAAGSHNEDQESNSKVYLSESALQNIFHKQCVAMEFYQVAVTKFQSIADDLGALPAILHKQNVALEFSQVSLLKFQRVADDLQNLIEENAKINALQQHSTTSGRILDQEQNYAIQNIVIENLECKEEVFTENVIEISDENMATDSKVCNEDAILTNVLDKRQDPNFIIVHDVKLVKQIGAVQNSNQYREKENDISLSEENGENNDGIRPNVHENGHMEIFNQHEHEIGYRKQVEVIQKDHENINDSVNRRLDETENNIDNDSYVSDNEDHNNSNGQIDHEMGGDNYFDLEIQNEDELQINNRNIEKKNIHENNTDICQNKEKDECETLDQEEKEKERVEQQFADQDNKKNSQNQVKRRKSVKEKDGTLVSRKHSRRASHNKISKGQANQEKLTCQNKDKIPDQVELENESEEQGISKTDSQNEIKKQLGKIKDVRTKRDNPSIAFNLMNNAKITQNEIPNMCEILNQREPEKHDEEQREINKNDTQTPTKQDSVKLKYVTSVSMKNNPRVVLNKLSNSSINEGGNSSSCLTKDIITRANQIFNSMNDEYPKQSSMQVVYSKGEFSKVKFSSNTIKELRKCISDDELRIFCLKYEEVFEKCEKGPFSIYRFPCPLCSNESAKDKIHLQTVHNLSNEAIKLLRTKMKMYSDFLKIIKELIHLPLKIEAISNANHIRDAEKKETSKSSSLQVIYSKGEFSKSMFSSETIKELKAQISDVKIKMFCEKYKAVCEKNKNKLFSIYRFPCPLCDDDPSKGKLDKNHLEDIHQLSTEAIGLLRTKMKMYSDFLKTIRDLIHLPMAICMIETDTKLEQ